MHVLWFSRCETQLWFSSRWKKKGGVRLHSVTRCRGSSQVTGAGSGRHFWTCTRQLIFDPCFDHPDLDCDGFFLASSEVFVLHRSGSCHLLIFTLNYGLRFSLLRGGCNKSRCCLVCRSQTTINSGYATNGNFAFGRSHIFLPFPPLVETFAVLYLWVKFNHRHQVETGTQCFQRHLYLQQELHQQYALWFGRWHCQSEKASNLSVAIVVPPARRRSISVSALAPGNLQELLAGSILKDSKVIHCEGI